MLPSLQDLPGMFPGIFHRGESAAAAEQAGRGQRPQIDHSHHGRAHDSQSGRDSLRLSPEARAVEDTAKGGEDTDGAVAEADGKSALGQAGGFIRKALETIRHDLGKALKAFGFDSAAVENFTKAFVEPVLEALKEGVNFTAELSFAAFSQVTSVSGNNVSQSTSLVAQSLEIEVNQDTGEVSVSLAKLSFEQQIQATTGEGSGGQAPLLVLDPEDLASPQELAQKILDGGVQPAETASGETASAPAEAVEGAESAAAEGEEAAEGAESPAAELEEKLADVRNKLAEEAVDLQTRLTIYSVSTYKNDKGESITKMLLDAQLKISALENDAPAQEEAESLNLTA